MTRRHVVESEQYRQLDLFLWSQTYTRAKSEIDARLPDLVSEFIEHHPRPDLQDYLAHGEVEAFLTAYVKWQRQSDSFWDNLYADALYQADKIVLRGTTMPWNEIRCLVWKRDRGICQVCKDQIAWDRYECGHIVDRCAGGSDRPSNLVVMCITCNRLKPVHETRKEYESWVSAGGVIGDLKRFISARVDLSDLKHIL